MNDLLLRALRSEEVERPPVWMMRQAGRYLPEYHEVRGKVDFLTLCRTPELAAEVTLQPLRRFRFDASIVFNDILVPPAAMGMDLHFEKGHGPTFTDPLSGPDDLSRLKSPSVERDMPEVLETIRLLVSQIDVPLFGFAGAPFTLAAYMVEGGGSKHFRKVKAFMHHHPAAFERLLGMLVDVVSDYMIAQIEAGAAAVQLFDTWAGELSPDDFRRFALAPAAAVLERVSGAPRLYFTKNAGPFLRWLPETGADALAMDWRVDMAHAREVLGALPVMGNLDPLALNGPEPLIREKVRRVIRDAGPKGHVFNLGHGLLPFSPIPGVEAAVDEVHRWRWSAPRAD
ncbi:MAG: uroporphyrinogen decarboxylase [Alphaproteobacteria bacterium]|nr:uroporphyrinogen decarboxylase [Alphaproteobacteria bacterium]MCB9792166.1 uroporphyrinogen decarboxylase [Alphaproteobacteria bacterium]